MKKFLKKKLGNEKGMTLIELLAVIVILAIIAAIAIPAISTIIENSRVGAAKSDAQMVLSASQLYLAENADALTVTPATITQAELVDGGFLDDLGSFEGTNTVATVVEQNAAGDLTLDGTAVLGGVTVVFDNVTRDDIAAAPNGTGSNPAEGETSETFTGPDSGTVQVTR